uniref:Uncharacterized protein n=1 Tax=Arundo donax TaxID=35708 RepID=A0A0A9ET84_ARUDO
MAPFRKACCRDFGSQVGSPITIRIGGLKADFFFSAVILRDSSARAKNSWSTITTSATEWSRRNAIVSAFNRILTQFTTAPDIGTPK